MLDHVEDSIRSLLNGRDLDVAFQRPTGPVEVLGDRIQLERALTNLLSNAVKFTEDGGRVRCRLERHPDEALVVVQDTGIGIPVDEQSGLFEKFFRSSTAQERAIQGTGLGLSIVAGIVAVARRPDRRRVGAPRGHHVHRPAAAQGVLSPRPASRPRPTGLRPG